MARAEVDDSFDLDKPTNRERLKTFIENARGWYGVNLSPESPNRTGAQNRTYWGFCVTPLAHLLMEQADRPLSKKKAKDMAHYILACENYGYDEVPHPLTGEMMRVPWTTTAMDVPTFSLFWDRCCVYLAQMGIVVQEPNPNYALHVLHAAPSASAGGAR